MSQANLTALTREERTAVLVEVLIEVASAGAPFTQAELATAFDACDPAALLRRAAKREDHMSHWYPVDRPTVQQGEDRDDT